VYCQNNFCLHSNIFNSLILLPIIYCVCVCVCVWCGGRARLCVRASVLRVVAAVVVFVVVTANVVFFYVRNVHALSLW
jgi:hypothetical protein